MPELTRAQWVEFLASRPEAHLLQTAAWGELKSEFGWRARWVAHGETGAQVLFRPIRLGFTLAYIPKGPTGQNWSGLWPEIDSLCRREKAVFLKVEPDVLEQAEEEFGHRCLPGFRPSAHAIQPVRTLLVDLEGGEQAVLERMKQKTRYNIRLAEKKDVTVRPCADLGEFERLMQATGQRDGFAVHSLDYYRTAYDLFAPQGDCALLVAEYAGTPLAAVMVFRRGLRAWYFYGASNEAERSRMPAYLVQWEAMRWAIRNGCREYDLWGIPDAEEAQLEAQFTARSDGLWGVYRFKRGFGGRVVRSVGAWDRVYLPPLYALYRAWMARRQGGDA